MASSSVSQDVVGSMSMQEEREPSCGRNHCVDGSIRGNLMYTFGVRDDGGHDGGWSDRADGENFFGRC